MLNFRKLRQDFSSAILKEGRQLYDKNKIVSAKIIRLDNETIRFNCRILGNFENTYESEIEVDRFESQAVHTNCDCPSRFDCVHLAALIFFLEEKMDALLIEYSKDADIAESEDLDGAQKKALLKTIKEAETKEVVKQDARHQKQILQEYISSSDVLSHSPFFLPAEESSLAEAELAVVFNPQSFQQKGKIEFQLALRLPFRSKPLQISHLKGFLEAVRYEEPLFVAGKRLFFSLKSFDAAGSTLLQMILDHSRVQENLQNERSQRVAQFDPEIFGQLLAKMHEIALDRAGPR
ncbi:MAG: SWIM zinc finger family protein, partial [Chlamydiae bacterium]|nr:SWIM zinc finger family protein [Chlamydiota bacterium]